ncbi:hypothetical protein LTS18_007993, partial [Coniosporium uncinatum]
MSSRAKSNAGTRSTASVASDTSRRSSLAGPNGHVNEADVDPEPPAKRTRLSAQAQSPSGRRRSSTKSSQSGDQLDSIEIPLDASVQEEIRANHDVPETIIEDKAEEEPASAIATANVAAVKRPRGWAIRGGRFKKGRGGRRKLIPAHTPADSTDVPSVPGTPTAFHDDDDQTDNGDSTQVKAVKRLPGRRRAPHPDPNIEAALRRQLHLKMGYRQMAKTLKSVLAELADRTMDDVQDDPEYHKQFEEHDIVMAELDACRDRRLRALEHELREKRDQLMRVEVAQEEILKKQFDRFAAEQREDYLLRCKNELLLLLRIDERDEDDEGTEDEDPGLVPPLRRPPSPAHPNGRIMDERYDSRSRVLIETVRRWKYPGIRLRARELRDGFVEQNAEEHSIQAIKDRSDFAVIDFAERETAKAALNINLIAEAAEAVEKGLLVQPHPPAGIIPNEAAVGLQMLASIFEQAGPAPLPLPKSHPPASARPTPATTPARLKEAQPMTPAPSTPRMIADQGGDAASVKVTDSTTKSSSRRSKKGSTGEKLGTQLDTPSKRNNINDILNQDQNKMESPINRAVVPPQTLPQASFQSSFAIANTNNGSTHELSSHQVHQPQPAPTPVGTVERLELAAQPTATDVNPQPQLTNGRTTPRGFAQGVMDVRVRRTTQEEAAANALKPHAPGVF